jgi:hypothetical protein
MKIRSFAEALGATASRVSTALPAVCAETDKGVSV